MKRRDFLQRSALATAFAITSPIIAAANTNDPPVLSLEPKPEAFELDEVTIAELQERMRSGKLTARSIIRKYLERIEEIDKGGPAINSVIEINPDAIAIAENLDRERRENRLRGPLHGIPILIKDNIDTADKMMTTAGSLALVGSPASQDAFIVRRLRESGAVILGKTNLSEWANFRSNHSSSGWSGRGGQTQNPYVLDRNPCGSSSGSGAAAAANLCVATIGTETDGSIVCPSSTNSLVGIKPTLGLVSRSGIIPIAHSQDTAGPMTRTVADAAVLLGVLAAADPRDPATQTPDRQTADYTAFLDDSGLRGARIGVARSFFTYHGPVEGVFETALDVMRKQGAILVDPVDFALPPVVDALELSVLLSELKAGLNTYLSALPSGVS